jgi:hypothetical protein
VSTTSVKLSVTHCMDYTLLSSHGPDS